MRKPDRNHARAAVLSLLLVASGCGGSSAPPMQPIAFGAEGNRLLAYETVEPFAVQTLIERRADDPQGWDINGQICFHPDGSRRFVAGEDTGQPNPRAGWGLFQLSGDAVGTLSAERIGKLTPTYQGGLSQAEPFGCSFLPDGRLVTSDVGNQSSGDPNGQLILWFPPFEGSDAKFCKLATDIGTAGGIWVDEEGRVLVASARATAGVHRFSPPFPNAPDAAGGCGRQDATGAPLADLVQRELFIPAGANSPTPNAVAPSGRGTLYVSSVVNGAISEYGPDGTFVRKILEAPPGEGLGPEPISTGSPMGIGVDREGRVFYADLAVVVDGARVGPGRNLGTYRMIEFDGDTPLAPRTLADGLAFPDGVGILD